MSNINPNESESRHLDSLPTAEVDNLYLASFCLARGAQIADTRMAGGTMVWTLRDLHIHDLVNAFHSNSAIGVQDFISRMRGLRSMVKTRRP